MFGWKWQWQMNEHHCCSVLRYFLLFFLLESVYIKNFKCNRVSWHIMVLSRRRMMLMVVLNGFWFWSLFGRQTYYQKCTILLIFYIIAWNNRRSLFCIVFCYKRFRTTLIVTVNSRLKILQLRDQWVITENILIFFGTIFQYYFSRLNSILMKINLLYVYVDKNCLVWCFLGFWSW